VKSTAYRLFAAAALVLLAVGCATETKVVEKKPQRKVVVYQNLAPEDLRLNLEKRVELLKNFSAAQVRAEVVNRTVPGGNQILTGAMAVEFPNKLTMVLNKPHTPIRLDLISDGRMFWIVNHAEKRVYRGSVHAGVTTGGRPVRFKPSDILNVIFCRELTRAAGFERRMVFVEAVANLYTIYVLNYDYPNKLYSKIWVDRHTLEVTGHQLYDPETGEVKVEAMFYGYSPVGQCDMPHGIRITWPEFNTIMDLQLKGVKVNQEWQNPDIFKYTPSRKAKEFEEVEVDKLAVPGGQTPGLQERPAPRKGPIAPWQTPTRGRFKPGMAAPRKQR